MVFASLALPVSLNGIGVREGVFVYFLHGYAARPQAVALGLAFYAVGRSRRSGARRCSWSGSSGTAWGP